MNLATPSWPRGARSQDKLRVAGQRAARVSTVLSAVFAVPVLPPGRFGSHLFRHATFVPGAVNLRLLYDKRGDVTYTMSPLCVVKWRRGYSLPIPAFDQATQRQFLFVRRPRRGQEHLTTDCRSLPDVSTEPRTQKD